MTKTHKYSPGLLGGAAAGRITCSSLLSHNLTAAADIYSWPSVLYRGRAGSVECTGCRPVLYCTPVLLSLVCGGSTREQCRTVQRWPAAVLFWSPLTPHHTTLPAAAGRGLQARPAPPAGTAPPRPAGLANIPRHAFTQSLRAARRLQHRAVQAESWLDWERPAPPHSTDV